MKLSFGWNKAAFGLLSLALGAAAAFYGQPLIHGNDQAIGVIVTVFSILAGFLVAIIAVIGDPLMLAPGSWRIAEHQRQIAYVRLVRHKWLFHLYLVTLATIFLSLVIPDAHDQLLLWTERVYTAFAASAFVLSLRIPGALMRMQQERLDSLIEHRRAASGIPARNTPASGVAPAGR